MKTDDLWKSGIVTHTDLKYGAKYFDIESDVIKNE
jgi:hypothetical protein